MGIFDKKPTEVETKTTTSPTDPFDVNAAKNIEAGAQTIANQSFIGYNPAARVAPLSALQNQGLSALGQAGKGKVMSDAYDYASGGLKGYGAAGASTARDPGRLVDEGGRLGKISDYMDPYLDNALKPAIRDIQEGGQKQRIGIGANATTSGAFGDARHGVVEGEQMTGELQEIGDLSSVARSNAFNTAMNLRAGDQSNFINNDQFNAAANEQMLQRQYNAAMGHMDIAGQRDKSDLDRAIQVLNGGQVQQQNAQSLRDAGYEEFLRAGEWPFRQFDAIKSTRSGNPSAQTTTLTQPQASPWMNALGAGGGALLNAIL